MVKQALNQAFTRILSFTEYVLPVFAGEKHYTIYRRFLYTQKAMFTNCLHFRLLFSYSASSFGISLSTSGKIIDISAEQMYPRERFDPLSRRKLFSVTEKKRLSIEP